MSSLRMKDGSGSSGGGPSDRSAQTCPFCDGTALYDGPPVSTPPTAEEIQAAENKGAAKPAAATGLRRCTACSGTGTRKGW